MNQKEFAILPSPCLTHIYEPLQAVSSPLQIFPSIPLLGAPEYFKRYNRKVKEKLNRCLCLKKIFVKQVGKCMRKEYQRYLKIWK
jgi:hypothetical protein